MQARLICCILFAATIFCGCSSRNASTDANIQSLTASENTLLNITNGESFEVVTNILGVAARHEFTVAEKNGNYIFLSCYFEGGDNALWFLFLDKTLIKIIEPFSFPELLETYPYEGTTATRLKSWNIDDPDIEARVEKVIDAPAMDREQVTDYLGPSSSSPSGSAWSIIPAFLLSGVLTPASPQMDKDYEDDVNLFARYNGCQVKIGMDTNEVEKLFGIPLRIITAKNGEVARIYAPARDLNWVNPQLAFKGLAVVSNSKGLVTAIYSDQFFCDSWKN
jgi:hypothetical protein